MPCPGGRDETSLTSGKGWGRCSRGHPRPGPVATPAGRPARHREPEGPASPRGHPPLGRGENRRLPVKKWGDLSGQGWHFASFCDSRCSFFLPLILSLVPPPAPPSPPQSCRPRVASRVSSLPASSSCPNFGGRTGGLRELWVFGWPLMVLDKNQLDMEGLGCF